MLAIPTGGEAVSLYEPSVYTESHLACLAILSCTFARASLSSVSPFGGNLIPGGGVQADVISKCDMAGSSEIARCTSPISANSPASKPLTPYFKERIVKGCNQSQLFATAYLQATNNG